MAMRPALEAPAAGWVKVGGFRPGSLDRYTPRSAGLAGQTARTYHPPGRGRSMERGIASLVPYRVSAMMVGHTVRVGPRNRAGIGVVWPTLDSCEMGAHFKRIFSNLLVRYGEPEQVPLRWSASLILP